MRNTKYTPRVVAKGKGGAAGGGGSINLIIARPLEEVDHSMATFAACWAADLIGTTSTTIQSGSSLYTETGNEAEAGAITVKNLDAGTVFTPTTGTYIDDGDEYVFALKRGMKFLAILCDDGEWQIIQSGGVLEDYDWASA